MPSVNLGVCEKCRKRVPAEHISHHGKVYLLKHCSSCGATESLVSGDADVWHRKRDIWQYDPNTPLHCSMQCDRCQIDHQPTIVFIDVTNRCNMNCPICIANIRGMGFEFHPPLAYFEKVFQTISTFDPTPMVELFGGEPTLRDDLIDIVNLGRSYGLRPRIVTNGIRLADEAYCRELCQAKVHFRFAFDGPAPEIYRRLRKNPDAYEKKMKALDNLKKWCKRKNAILCCVARDINEQYIGELIQFCHDNMNIIDELGLIPLTENWEPGSFESVESTTAEDVEHMVERSVPDGDVEFFPAGLAHGLRTARAFFRRSKRSRTLMLGGVHPNCESMALLVSDGKQYRSVNHKQKMPVSQIAQEVLHLHHRIEATLTRLDHNKRWQRLRGQILIFRTFFPLMRRAVDLRALFKGHPLVALMKMLVGLVRGRQGRDIFYEHTSLPRVLPVTVLPFEPYSTIDADRLSNCKAVFVYEDIDTGQIKTSPACTWDLYRNDLLKRVSDKYVIAGSKREGVEAVSVSV